MYSTGIHTRKVQIGSKSTKNMNDRIIVVNSNEEGAGCDDSRDPQEASGC